MKIDVFRLKENQVENYYESLSPAELELETNDVKYIGNINIATEARKEMSVVFTKMHVSAKVELVCSRCLKEYPKEIEHDFDIKYPLYKSEQFIDATQDIREEIIVSYPVKSLCKSDCRGLCFKCGQDLNEGNCGCQMSPPE